jgi:uncharacterized membrane protein YeaQ/YmgE (transglycosylase-associated protein family)
VPNPPVVLGFILATLYGAAFHLIVGGNTRRMALYILAGWLGFGLGQVFGTLLGVRVLSIGPINTFSATLGAWLALVVTRILTDERWIRGTG